MKLHPLAKRRLIDFANSVEIEMKSGGNYSSIKGLAAKITEHATRIAAILFAVDNGRNISLVTDSAEIDEATAERAITLARWYLHEWLRLKGIYTIPETLRLAKLLQDWALSDSNPHAPLFYSTQAQQFAPNKLRTKTALDVAINVLAEHGLIRLVEPTKLDNATRKNVYQVRQATDTTLTNSKNSKNSSPSHSEKQHNDNPNGGDYVAQATGLAPAMEEAF
jgi:hypothetical protein